MKFSSVTAALIAAVITTAAARPSVRNDVKSKSYYYKQLAKLVFLAGEDDENKCEYRGYQCCRSYEKIEDDEGSSGSKYRGIHCLLTLIYVVVFNLGHQRKDTDKIHRILKLTGFWIPNGFEDSCKDYLHEAGFHKGCCSACSRSIVGSPFYIIICCLPMLDIMSLRLI